MLRPPQSSHDRLIWFGHSRIWLCVLCVQEAEMSEKRVLVADPFNQHSIICFSSNIHKYTYIYISYIIYYTWHLYSRFSAHIRLYIYIYIYLHIYIYTPTCFQCVRPKCLSISLHLRAKVPANASSAWAAASTRHSFWPWGKPKRIA